MTIRSGTPRAAAAGYTAHWSRHLERNVRRHLAHLAGRPLRYLEIGVFEGRSACWMLENVLTHPASRMVGIDAWGWNDGTIERAHTNLRPHRGRVELLRGDSAWVLRDPRFEPESFDLVYVDGCHRALEVLTDSALAWPLVKLGGHLIWDDYMWKRLPWKRRVAKHERPGEAIDAFLLAIRGQHEILFRNHQVGVRRTGRPENPFRSG